MTPSKPSGELGCHGIGDLSHTVEVDQSYDAATVPKAWLPPALSKYTWCDCWRAGNLVRAAVGEKDDMYDEVEEI